MAASTITPIGLKKSLIQSEIISFSDDDKYNACRVERLFGKSELWTQICYYIDHFLKNNTTLTYDTVITFNASAIPFATDIAITNNKKLLLYNGGKLSIVPPDMDSKVLLVIDKIRTDADYDTIAQLVKKLSLYDITIAGILVIFDRDLGDYIRLTTTTTAIHSVFSLCDICDTAYSANLITHYEYEKYKFFSEKMIKTELQKFDA